MEGYHEPVLLKEVLKFLKIEPGRRYIDATVGDGGYTLEILKAGGNVLGIDVDPDALMRAEERLRGLGEYELIQGNFRDIKNLIQKMGLTDQKFSGIIFDLGVSSLQLESPERGFSFSKDGPLDMRMDPSLSVRAEDLIKVLNKGELYELFSKLGEEKFAKQLVGALVSPNKIGTGQKRLEIRNTVDLANLVERVYRKHGVRSGRIPAHAKSTAGKHPATRVFQALRIAVNDELNALKEVLPQCLNILEEKGRIVIISFHSLEDRIAKQTFKTWEEVGLGKVITKKPFTPTHEEIMNNQRSRSAKMRVFEK